MQERDKENVPARNVISEPLYFLAQSVHSLPKRIDSDFYAIDRLANSYRLLPKNGLFLQKGSLSS